MDLGSSGKEGIHTQNILLRGCVLRNTDWIIGIIVNTGHDTKIMMGNKATKAKVSSLEANSSVQVYFFIIFIKFPFIFNYLSLKVRRIIILLVAVCFAAATGQAIWDSIYDLNGFWYLNVASYSAVGQWFLAFCYFFLLHASFIPGMLFTTFIY